jgi:hypothetical protein
MPFEEPLVQVYRTRPFDMMPMAMGKDFPFSAAR